MKLQITIHVFGYGVDGTERRDEVWVAEIPADQAARGINPLMLRADVFGETSMYIFSLERVAMVENVAHYYPFATHLKLPFLEQLPKYGWAKIDPAKGGE